MNGEFFLLIFHEYIAAMSMMMMTIMMIMVILIIMTIMSMMKILIILNSLENYIAVKHWKRTLTLIWSLNINQKLYSCCEWNLISSFSK